MPNVASIGLKAPFDWEKRQCKMKQRSNEAPMGLSFGWPRAKHIRLAKRSNISLMSLIADLIETMLI